MHTAAKYKTDHGTPFYFNGRPISQLIDESRKNNKTEKENQIKLQSGPTKKDSMPLKSQGNISLQRKTQSKS